MKKIKALFGMAYASPAVRTVVQAGVGAGLAVLVAAGVDLNADVVKLAVGAALAGALAKLQAVSRADG